MCRDQVMKVGASFFKTEVNEARFAYFSKPCKVLGSYHEHNIPTFEKTKPRDNSSIFYKNMTLKDYSPSQPSYLGSLRSGCIF